MPNKRRRSLSGPNTPARLSEASSVHSVTDSNDYIQSLVNYFRMPRDPNVAKAHWDANMEIHFCMTFVEWKRSGEWNPNVSSEANWMKLAAHLNSQWGKQYAWSVYHSKFGREKRIWHAFAKLKGLRQSAETGIGWDENRRCFLAEESQWNNLCLENNDYRYFRFGQCVDKYAILHEILESETATGSQVQASSVPPSVYNPRKRGGHSRGQTVTSPVGDDMYNAGMDGDFNEESPVVGVKRGSSSQGVTTSLPSASRGSKSSRSTNDPFVECANSLSSLANSKLRIKATRASDKEKFDVDMAVQVVESFGPSLDKGAKLAAFCALQDDKWRKTFLSSSREMQEFWLYSLVPPPKQGPDGPK
ncbi:uncharacterized protein [Coffea arabica]|uniref:Uncharacterized protein isoform X1 n=2 Tax=Coffea arabica TaxID=13443 RepID=A0A6P6USK7_COFAR